MSMHTLVNRKGQTHFPCQSHAYCRIFNTFHAVIVVSPSIQIRFISHKLFEEISQISKPIHVMIVLISMHLSW